MYSMYCMYLQIEIRVTVLSNTVKLDFLCLKIPPSPLFRSTQYMERKHVDWEVGDQFESRLFLNVVFFTFYFVATVFMFPSTSYVLSDPQFSPRQSY